MQRFSKTPFILRHLLQATLVVLLYSPPTSLVCAVLKNITVDDCGLDPTNGVAFTYLPNADVFALGQTCNGCEAQVNASLAYNGSWHDTTYDPTYPTRSNPRNITFEFTGKEYSQIFIPSFATEPRV